jgi:DNA (cytosine-5)-methyltransferase 1
VARALVKHCDAIDLFAGAGGWDLAAGEIGLDVLGIELDKDACDTRAEAGLRTRRGDIAALDPADFAPVSGSLQGLIASPPCQAYSTAGKRQGEVDKPNVYRLAAAWAAGENVSAADFEWADDRSPLVAEPIRWAKALQPTWMAFEQVPPVLELWREFETIFRSWGYHTWAGILSAERYGVPQTRRRAILLAHRDRPVAPPEPTHQEYVPGVPARHEVTLLGEVLPWVSMAKALGWGMTARPSVTVSSGGESRRGAKPLGGGSGSGETIAEERERGDWTDKRPAPTIVTTRRSEDGLLVGRQLPEGEGRNVGGKNWKLKAGNQENAAVRDADEPAPTVAYGNNAAAHEWVPPTHMAKTEDRSERRAQGAGNRPRPVDAPAATVDSRLDLAEWVTERPSTSVCGDPRISPPGYRGRADDYDADGNYQGERSMDGAVRVSLEIKEGPGKGRGGKEIARIGVLAVETQRLGAIMPDADEARREGFPTARAFFDYWVKLYGEFDPGLWVDRIEFKLIDPEDYRLWEGGLRRAEGC